MSSPRVGTGGEITFGTSALELDVRDVNWSGISVEIIDTSHLGTTGTRTKIPGELKDGGEVSVAVVLDPDDLDGILAAQGVAETITVKSPTVTGESTPQQGSFSGCIRDISYSMPNEDLMTADLVIAVLGAITFSDAS